MQIFSKGKILGVPISPIEEQVEGLLSPIEKFTRHQISTGILLGIASIFGMIIVNSPLHDSFHHLGEYTLGIFLENHQFSLPLHEWIASGLMAIFFLYIGLELKKEMLVGELRHIKQSVTVLAAAFGGMAMPGLIYLAFNYSSEHLNGWAIPMATDAAFALGALALMTRYTSPKTFAFLAALAIFDDLGAVMIIAFFYSHGMDIIMLAHAAIVFSILMFCNFLGIRNTAIYTALSLILWYYMFQSGIHATVAGILVAIAVPARPKVMKHSFMRRVKALLFMMEQVDAHEHQILKAPKQHNLVSEIRDIANKASTPLQLWESRLKPRVALYILPIFALFNAGVVLSADNLSGITASPVVLGIFFGLFLGKPIGITACTWLALKLFKGRLPQGLNLSDIFGLGMLGGMGFTMSLLIANISFEAGSQVLEQSKLGILTASVAAGISGIIWLYYSYKAKQKQP